MTRLEGSQVPRGVLPSESETLKRARGDEPGGKGLGSGSAEGAAEKQRGAEGARGARRAGGATWALASASQTQGGRVLLAFSLRSAMLEFLLVVLAAAAAATTEAAEAESAASVASGSPKGGAGNIM